MNLDLFFWQDWPLARQRMFFRLLVLAWAAILIIVWSSLYAMTNTKREEVGRLERRYSQIEPMVAEIQSLRSSKGSLADLLPMPAAQQIIREMKLDSKLASIRPTELGGGGKGVQMLLESLDLNELLGLIQQLEVRGGLKFLSLTFNHRLDNPMLADVQFVLAR